MAYRQPASAQRVSSWALNTLAVLGVFYSLYAARALLLPLVLALLLALLFTPVVLGLQRRRVPRPVGALIVVLGLLAVLTVGIALLAQPASDWLNRAPALIAEIDHKLNPLTSRVKEFSEAAEKVEGMTNGDGEGGDRDDVARGDGASLTDILLEGTAAALGATAIVFLLLYFLLATGDRLERNARRVMPHLGARRRLTVVTRRIQREVSRYLLAVTVINTVLGLLVMALALAVGLPNPILWGVVAALLNYIPYLGPVVTIGVLAAVSLMTLPLPNALIMPAAFAALTSLEGQLITPTVLGRHLSLNPVFVLAGLIFWGWLWGPVGALLAVPIMASAKIVCDNHRPLHAVGIMLGR